MARCFTNGYWVNDQQSLPQSSCHMKGRSAHACSFVPPKMQVLSVRSIKQGGQREPHQRFPSALFSVQSLLILALGLANGQERGKERLIWKNSGLGNYLFPQPYIGLFLILSTLETAKVRLGVVSQFSVDFHLHVYRL